MSNTRGKVLELYQRGLAPAEIARELAVAKSTISYHLRRLDIEPDERFSRRYDWDAVQRYYDEGHTVSECQARFGFARCSWSDARERGLLSARPRSMPLDELLTGPRCRTHLKQRLLDIGLKENRCEVCGVEKWLGSPLSMALHHINGDGADNRLENLQMLCPNCHSQTENFAGRNRRRAADAQGELGEPVDLRAIRSTTPDSSGTAAVDVPGCRAVACDPHDGSDIRGSAPQRRDRTTVAAAT